jgi:ADP-L-glycero-D-manno-heptose 6-epimerase
MPESLRNQYQYYTEAPIDKLRAAGYKAEIASLETGVYDYITKHLLQSAMIW